MAVSSPRNILESYKGSEFDQKFCEQDTKNTLYKALVRPKMEYASVVCDPYHQCDIDKLEYIQRAAVPFCKMTTGIPPA